jgi:integrase
MHRPVEPLKQKSMHLFVHAAEEMKSETTRVVALLLLFTGIRVNTLTHLRWDWFHRDDGDLYLKVPSEEPCLKYGTSEPCGDCSSGNNERYTPKTPAGEGRRIKIVNSWQNYYTETASQQPIDLPELVEHYFKTSSDGVGHEMVNGDGISSGTANNYIKKVAKEAEIGFYRKPGRVEHERFGVVPDLFPHDLRASFCVQLMRNDANPFKAITKTGHKDVESLEPYVKFAEQEVDSDFEEEYI